MAESHFALPDDRHFYAFADQERYDRFDEGVGRSILRLPDNPLAPFPPEVGTIRRLPSSESASHIRLVGDWRTAEDVALWHMSGPLGFFDSRLTGGVSDRGVDVEHPEAVAQVKMQANPVGSPLIRQLRGARPHLTNHVFYSTSGYTRAAITEASGVQRRSLHHL
ncbi:restriction endonuclease [Arthrobacter sp. SA17]